MFVGKMSDWLRSPEVVNSNFLIWVYRRVYTPYEVNERFSDESVFEDSHACEVRIKEVIELSDGDYLLGVQSYDEIEEKYYAQIDYYKLSEIRLARKNHKGNEECFLFEEPGTYVAHFENPIDQISDYKKYYELLHDETEEK